MRYMFVKKEVGTYRYCGKYSGKNIKFMRLFLNIRQNVIAAGFINVTAGFVCTGSDRLRLLVKE